MKIVLVRHGETEGNLKGLYEGKKDSSINENGRIQARYLGQLLKKYRFSKIYCSPQKRCTQTLSLILENLENKTNDISYLEELKEIDFGAWEGLDYITVEKLFPGEWRVFIEDYKNITFPQGESFREFYNRCSNLFNTIKTSSMADEAILIVTHGGVIRALLSNALCLGMDGFYNIKPKQGAFSEINLYGESFEIEYINKD